jgi:hypothetical protein
VTAADGRVTAADTSGKSNGDISICHLGRITFRKELCDMLRPNAEIVKLSLLGNGKSDSFGWICAPNSTRSVATIRGATVRRAVDSNGSARSCVKKTKSEDFQNPCGGELEHFHRRTASRKRRQRRNLV